MKRLTLMVRAADVARADIAITPERIYYRFATDTSIEDGDLPAPQDFDALTAALDDEARAREGETPLRDDVRMQVFRDNVLETAPRSEQSLRRAVELLRNEKDEFAWLGGFVFN